MAVVSFPDCVFRLGTRLSWRGYTELGYEFSQWIVGHAHHWDRTQTMKQGLGARGKCSMNASSCLFVCFVCVGGLVAKFPARNLSSSVFPQADSTDTAIYTTVPPKWLGMYYYYYYYYTCSRTTKNNVLVIFQYNSMPVAHICLCMNDRPLGHQTMYSLTNG